MNTARMAIAALCLALAAGGCGPSGGESGPNAPSGRLIGVSFQTMNNPFFVDLNEGLKSVVEARGDTLMTLDAQWNSLKQRNDISDLAMQDAAAIFINPVNWEGIKGSLVQAREKGIPCIVVDAPVRDRELALATVASDNAEAGRLAARALAEAQRPAKIGILQLSINKACIDRVAGFKEALAEYPDMEIVDAREVKGNIESARPVMRDMIGRFPELNAVFAINDPTALGAISALESAGKLANVILVSVDGAPEALSAIMEGKLLATSAQFPREIGETAARLLYDHFDGKPIETDVKVRVELIDKDNAAEYMRD